MAIHDRAIGPNNRHPITGVKLNRITVKRRELTFTDAVTVHILRQQGKTIKEIARYLGTGETKVRETLRGEVHQGAAHTALEWLILNR